MNQINNDSPTKTKKNGLLKQLILTICFGIALLIMALFASGILFTGAVVQNTSSAIKDTATRQ